MFSLYNWSGNGELETIQREMDNEQRGQNSLQCLNGAQNDGPDVSLRNALVRQGKSGSRAIWVCKIDVCGGRAEER